MKNVIDGALELVGVNRKFLTLLVVCIAAAAVYVWGARGYQERDRFETFARSACAAAGATYSGEPAAKDKAMRRDGAACLARIGALQKFEADVNRGSAEQLLGALDRRLGKDSTDALLARRAAEGARAAALRMEAADAAVQGDRVGPTWFDALNQSAGLRPSPPGR